MKPLETPVELVLPQSRLDMYLPLDGDEVRWFFKWLGSGSGADFVR